MRENNYNKRYLGVLCSLLGAVFLISADPMVTPVNALELVQETNPTTQAPRVPASDIIFNHDFNPKTGFTYELGEKFKAYEKIYRSNNGSGSWNCSNSERPDGTCYITEYNDFGVFYAPEEGELVRGEEKLVPGRIIKMVYTDVAQDVDGERLDFVVELSNLKITPMPNLPDTSTVQVPKQEWTVFRVKENMTASADRTFRPSMQDVQDYIDCYRDTSCDLSVTNGKITTLNEHINNYDITFSFYKTGTTEPISHNVTFDFRDLDGVRTDRKTGWSSIGTPIVREGIQLKSGVADGRVYTINPLIPGEADNNGFRLRVNEDNTILEAPCYRYSSGQPVVADGDQTSNCKQWEDNDSRAYNTGFAAIFLSTGTFSWQAGSNLNTTLFNTLGSMLSIEKTSSKSKVKFGDSFEYNIKVTHRTDSDPVSDNIVIEDAMPDQLEITSIPEYCEQSDQKITCTVPPEVFNASGGEMNFPISVKVREVSSGVIVNKATIDIGLYDNCDTNRVKLDNNGGKQCSVSVEIESVNPDDPDGPPVVPEILPEVTPTPPATGEQLLMVELLLSALGSLGFGGFALFLVRR